MHGKTYALHGCECAIAERRALRRALPSATGAGPMAVIKPQRSLPRRLTDARNKLSRRTKRLPRPQDCHEI
jgi:hypothetical protein